MESYKGKSGEKKNSNADVKILKGVWFYLNLLWDVSEVSATDRLISPPGVEPCYILFF